jgi:21S rRNA (uridine2791-2'-O)-methyltransferase
MFANLKAQPLRLPMLSRRVFQQLTESLLLGSAYRPAATLCFTSKCASCKSYDRAIIRQSSSSTRWKSRQGKDFFAKEARVQGLKSRAAFKLLEVLHLFVE